MIDVELNQLLENRDAVLKPYRAKLVRSAAYAVALLAGVVLSFWRGSTVSMLIVGVALGYEISVLDRAVRDYRSLRRSWRVILRTRSTWIGAAAAREGIDPDADDGGN